MSNLSDSTTMVVGASRGLGHGIAGAFAEAGAPVVAVSRTAAPFREAADGSGRIQPEIADASEPTVPASVLDRYEPQFVILVAGASPHMRPLQQQTWETFSVNWQTDVRMTFHWLREALLKPLQPGSRVVVFSSGAVLNPNGSPLSGGYAGAKAAQRFMTAYAQEEAAHAGLEITFTAVLPQHRRPASAARRCAHTQLEPASPLRISSTSVRFRYSLRRSRAPPWSTWYRRTPATSRRPTCSTAPDCRSCPDGDR
jgi:3-oxoacyl-[acyl-carrier protein] reductase